MTCWECIDTLVRLVEIPHMIYRNYDQSDLVKHYFMVLRSRIDDLESKGCISESTLFKLTEWVPKIKRAIDEGKRPYEETEAILSVLKGECVKDVADYCRTGPLGILRLPR